MDRLITIKEKGGQVQVERAAKPHGLFHRRKLRGFQHELFLQANDPQGRCQDESVTASHSTNNLSR
jgi:hypothetical protein